MIHDKFCDYAGLETMGEPCWQCNAIERARADEREQAAQRVEAVGWMDSGALRLHVIPTDEAVTAARGVSHNEKRPDSGNTHGGEQA